MLAFRTSKAKLKKAVCIAVFDSKPKDGVLLSTIIAGLELERKLNKEKIFYAVTDDDTRIKIFIAQRSIARAKKAGIEIPSPRRT